MRQHRLLALVLALILCVMNAHRSCACAATASTSAHCAVQSSSTHSCCCSKEQSSATFEDAKVASAGHCCCSFDSHVKVGAVTKPPAFADHSLDAQAIPRCVSAFSNIYRVCANIARAPPSLNCSREPVYILYRSLLL